MSNKTMILKSIMTVSAVVIMSITLHAQTNPGGSGGNPGGGPPPAPTGAPIDGGAAILLAGVAGYAYRKLKGQKEQKEI